MPREVWDAVEVDEFRKANMGAGVLHFRPAALAHRCPGVRCDGMHFASDFPAYGCRGSPALWDPVIAHFLMGMPKAFSNATTNSTATLSPLSSGADGGGSGTAEVEYSSQ